MQIVCNCGRLTGKPRSQTVFSLSNCSSLRGNRRGRGVQYQSSIVSLAPLQLAVANTSLQCMCCLGNTRYLAQGCVLFRSVLCPAWLGSPVCPVCPCCPFTWPFTAQHSCWPEKSAKIFFTPLVLSLSVSFFSAASGLHGLSINTPFAFIQYKSSAAGQTKGDTAGGRVYGGGRWLL